MDTPSYVLALLDKELRRVQEEMLAKVATKYELDFDELCRDFLASPLKLVPNKQVTLVIKKDLQPKPQTPTNVRCFARVWNRGKGGQCTRKRRDGCEYCSQHTKERKHGDIRNSPDATIFHAGAKPKCLYK